MQTQEPDVRMDRSPRAHFADGVRTGSALARVGAALPELSGRAYGVGVLYGYRSVVRSRQQAGSNGQGVRWAR